MIFFFFKQKTAYEMRISDWSSDVCSSDLLTSIDDMLKLAMPNADIAVNKMNGMVLLTGTIAAPEDAAEAERLTQAFVGKEVTVVSRLRTATPLQVNLQVKIAEVSRDVGHRIGMNWKSQDLTGGKWAGGIGGGPRDAITFNSGGGGTFNFTADGGYRRCGWASEIGGAAGRER